MVYTTRDWQARHGVLAGWLYWTDVQRFPPGRSCKQLNFFNFPPVLNDLSFICAPNYFVCRGQDGLQLESEPKGSYQTPIVLGCNIS